MQIISPSESATLVLDVGKTNVKLLVMDKAGSILDVLKTENRSLDKAPYLQLDTERVWTWLMDSAGSLARKYSIDAIVPSTHGCSAVLVDDNGAVLPPMDYEAEPPPDIDEAFEALTPPFSQTQAPRLPQGQNLGRQLFWLQREFPDAFAKVRWVLTYPQYWAWRLSGVAASEVTSIGCHTHLWEPGYKRFSSLVRERGWENLFPPFRSAFDVLGPITPEVVERSGLLPACKVYTGIHDANAAYCLYLRGHDRPFSLASTGTWVVMFSPRKHVSKLDAQRDTMAISNVLAEPLPIARFMGGREFELLTGDLDSRQFTEADMVSVIQKQSFLLPSYAAGGPFPQSKGATLGPELTEHGEILARATLYLALMTRTSMAMMESDGDLMIDGGFVNNIWYCRLLATLLGHKRCYLNHETEGTAVGAGMLAVWNDTAIASPLKLTPVEKIELSGLHKYVETWKQMADNHSSRKKGESAKFL